MPHPPNPSLLALKPRQLLLSSCSNSMAQTQTLKPEQRSLLLRSIAGFLRRSAFSKTLKKFLPEAQIQEDDAKGSSLDLEEIFCKFLNTCDPSIINTNGDKVEDEQEDGKSKKKKKRSEGNDGHPTLSQSEGDDKSTADIGLRLDASEKKPKEKKKKGKVDTEAPEMDAEAENKTKDKKKKKNQPTSESIVQTDEHHVAENVSSEDKNAKSKKKKKRKDDSVPAISKDSEGQEKELPTLIKCTKGGGKTLNEDVVDKECKGSKKRKREDADENESQVVSEKAEEESKRRKKEDLKDDEGTKQPVENSVSVDGNKNAKKESEGNEQNSALQKSAKGKSNGSASAKKPFQRVNVEEVEFIDKRLEDNSYWAKDGAETGYGAKAQEVLGQVRGRDFRHEKTKKKRGTYRGGQIDLQSHSVKFQYSDEE